MLIKCSEVRSETPGVKTRRCSKRLPCQCEERCSCSWYGRWRGLLEICLPSPTTRRSLWHASQWRLSSEGGFDDQSCDLVCLVGNKNWDQERWAKRYLCAVDTNSKQIHREVGWFSCILFLILLQVCTVNPHAVFPVHRLVLVASSDYFQVGIKPVFHFWFESCQMARWKIKHGLAAE